MVNSGLTCYDFNLAKATSPDTEYKAQAVANIGFGDGQKNVEFPSSTLKLVNRRSIRIYSRIIVTIDHASEAAAGEASTRGSIEDGNVKPSASWLTQCPLL